MSVGGSRMVHSPNATSVISAGTTPAISECDSEMENVMEEDHFLSQEVPFSQFRCSAASHKRRRFLGFSARTSRG